MKALLSSGRRRIGSSKSPAIPRRAAAQIIFKWQPVRINFNHDDDDDDDDDDDGDRKTDQAQPRGSDAVAVAIKAAKTATMVRVVVPIICDPIM